MVEDNNRRRGGSTARHLSATAYRYAASSSFTLWGGILLAFAYSRAFTAWVGRGDLFQLAQASAALAAVILAVLSLLEQLASRDRYLKLALSALLIMFVAATVASLLSAFTMPLNSDVRLVHLRAFLLGGLYVSVGITGTIAVSAEKANKRGRFSSFFNHLRSLFAVFDYSPSVLPFFAFALWSRELSLAATAVALTIGGTVYLLCSTVAMFVSVWRHKTRPELLEPQLLEFLARVREMHQNGRERPAPVSLADLRNRTRSNDENLTEALDKLCHADLVVRVDYDSFYLLADSDWTRCVEVVRTKDIVVLPDDSRGDRWREIAVELSNDARIPTAVIEKFMLRTVEAFVKGEFRLVGEANHHCVYIKSWGLMNKLRDGRTTLRDLRCLPQLLRWDAEKLLERKVAQL